MKKLVESFKKETAAVRFGLIAAVVAFLSTFAPWISIQIAMPYGNFGGSASGWHSYGLLTVLGTLVFVAAWVLPQVKPEIKLPVESVLLKKIAAGVMLAGVVLWCVSADFSFDFLGWGWYVGLVASGTALYFSLQKE